MSGTDSMTKRSGIITLLTDFGDTDWFVGSMKGVIAGICPRARTIDITHQVPPGDIRRGALALKCSFRYFPRGTVHLAVVDPGVGSSRAVLAARGGDHLFVAPDNGLLSYVLPALADPAVFSAVNAPFFRAEVSDTFHGRDIFAPLAAHLAGGLEIDRVGPRWPAPVMLPPPFLHREGENRWAAEIIGIDRFGNCITSLFQENAEVVTDSGKMTRIILAAGKKRYSLPLMTAYNSVPAGSRLAVWGSCGFLELAANGENAGRDLGLKTGDRVVIDFTN